MELYMQKLLQVLKAAATNKPVPKMKIEEQELFEMQELMLDFSHLVSYENNDALQNNRILKQAINDGLFYEETYAAGTLQQDNLINQHKEIKDLQIGECYAQKDLSKTKQCINELQTIFRKEENDAIRIYTWLLPFKDVEPEFLPAYNYVNLQKNGDIEKEGEFLFLKPQDSDEHLSCFLKDDKMAVLGYDVRRNPFSKKHFRVFDQHGEIEDFSHLNYAHLIKRIRAAEAHHKIYNYYNGKPYGGKVVPLGNGTTALFSNRWHEFLMRSALSSLNERKNEFNMLCVPHSQKSIRTDEQCIEKIDSIRRINVKTAKTLDSAFAYAWIKKIVEAYEASPTKNKTMQEYFDTQLSKWLGTCTCKIDPLGNTQLLKNRLVGDQTFYNIHNNDKENAIEQDYFIKHILSLVYENSYTTSEGILPNGKVQPIHINLQDLCLFIRAELPRLHNLTGVLKGAKWQKETASFANVEKQITIPILCAYKNLIRNHFVDDALKYANVPAGFDLKGEQLDGKRKLSVLNMDMFEIYKNNKKGGVENPQTFEQKANVLRAIRNAISHNQVYVQFNRTGDMNETKYVFDFGEYSKIRVNLAKFEEFINQPLFADYKSLDKYTIKAKDTKELKQFIQKLCENEILHGRDNEFVSE